MNCIIKLLSLSVFIFSIENFPQFLTEPTNIPNLGYGDADWGDYDNDGDLDLLVSGFTQAGSTYSAIFRNDSGVFTNINANIISARGPVKWGDYDSDGDLDFFIGGYRSSSIEASARIYNNDNGVFTSLNLPLTPILEGDADWGDYDNDGDLDLIYIGAASNSNNIDYTRLYKNEGDSFINSNLPFVNMSFGSVEWGDYDNDADLDILFSGSNQSGTNDNFRIYRNDGSGFSLINLNIPVFNYSKAAWCDYDNDGDLDFAVSGTTQNFTGDRTKVYRNDGNTFTDTEIEFEGAYKSGLAWGDFDNDGDADLVVAGVGVSSNIIKLYRNDDSTFTLVSNPFIPIEFATLCWGDYDNNGTLDLFETGGDSGPFYTRLYKNTTTVFNSPPSIPTNLTAEIFSDSIRFMWDPSTDGETPSPGLSYNIRVGTSFENENIMPGNSLLDGQRKIVQIGNVQKRTSWTLKNLPTSICFFQVQAIDQMYKGSEWTYGIYTPVEFSSFNATQINDFVELKWITASELNNNGFEIQRSTVNNKFLTIGFIKGKGTTSNPTEYLFKDKNLQSNKYCYRLKQIDYNGNFKCSDIVEINFLYLNEFNLHQNYPNPFNPSTKISWQSPVSGWHTLKIYDVLGNEVTTLVNEYREAGSYNVQYTMNNLQLSSGIYFYRLQAGDFVETKKMTLLK